MSLKLEDFTAGTALACSNAIFERNRQNTYKSAYSCRTLSNTLRLCALQDYHAFFLQLGAKTWRPAHVRQCTEPSGAAPSLHTPVSVSASFWQASTCTVGLTNLPLQSTPLGARLANVVGLERGLRSLYQDVKGVHIAQTDLQVPKESI